MNQAFSYVNGQLQSDGVVLADVAAEFGTPCYVYSRQALEARYLDYERALADIPHLVCYAVKANANLALLQVLARLGAGFDIVSGGELERVLRAGGEPSRIVFSGVGKTAAEMARALEVGIHCFNVESSAELERLNEVAISLGKVANVSLRVNPDVDAQTHPYISTGLKDNKFGVDITEAPALYRRANRLTGLQVLGVDCHIGSQLTSLDPYLDALERLLGLIDLLAAEGIVIEHLDLGGGLGVRYREENPPLPAEYIAAIRQRLGERKLRLVFEPGRYISAEAGALLMKVEYLKHTTHKNFAIVDAAMNDQLRPALYQAWMNIVPLREPDPDSVRQARTYDVVGPVCESADFMGKDRRLNLRPDDLLALLSAGAYSFAMSSNYNTRNRAPEVMLDRGRAHLVRRRETFEDQLGPERLLDEDAL